SDLTAAPGPVSPLGTNGDYFTIATGAAPMTFISADVVRNTDGVSAGALNMPIIRVKVSVTGVVPISARNFNFSRTGTSNPSAIANAKVYYTGTNPNFSTANQIGSTISAPVPATFSVNQNITLVDGDNYFWVAYDVASGASLGDSLAAECANITIADTVRTIVSPAAGSRVVTLPMTLVSSNAAQPLTAKVEQNSNNNLILRLDVEMSASGAPIAANSFTFNTNGSVAPTVNITNAKLYYTGNNGNFSTSTLFGTFTGPNGAFTITGNVNLNNGMNYFWLTYDIPSTAVIGDSVDAEYTGLVLNGSAQTGPVTTAPAGAREIRAPYCVSGATVAGDSDIGRVIMSSGGNPIMNVGTGCGTAQAWATGTYTNNTGIGGINLVTGSTINFDICYASSGAAYNSGLAIYIDFNQNGLWDAGEMVYTSPTQLSTSWIGSFTVPCTALNGPTRMRLVAIEFTNLTLANSCGTYSYGETEDYTVNIVNAPPTYVASNAIQQIGQVGAGTNDVPILRVPVKVVSTLCIPGTINQLNFNTAGTTNAGDIVSAKLYRTGINAPFSVSNLVGTVSAPNGAFSFPLTDTTFNDTNNYWLAYDVSSTASNSNLLDARFDSALVFGAWRTPINSNPTGAVTVTVPMTYLGSDIIHPTIAKVERGTVNNQFLRIMVRTSSTGAPINVTQFSLNTNGSANPLTNMDSAIIWYTGSNPNFATTNFFGGVGAQSGAFNINGLQNLGNDTNYFWLTYNLPATAAIGDSLDAELSSITIAGTPQTPTTTAPAGAREIRAPYCVSGATTAFDSDIGRVIFTSGGSPVMNVGTGCGTNQAWANGTYTNNTGITGINLVAGSTINFDICYASSGAAYNSGMAIYIDFNQNGLWDAGEMVYTAPTQLSTNWIGSFTVPCTALNGPTRMRIVSIEFTNLTLANSCGTFSYGETEDYTVNIIREPASYVASTTIQQVATTSAGAVNIPILRVPLIVRATPCLPGIISQLNFNTAGSTTAGDILSAKLYKTGNSNVFSTANLVGTVATPNGDFSFLISDTAVNDTNNYWLAYDISTTASNSNVVDARFDSALIFGTWRTPAVSSPAGNVTISVPMTYISSNVIHPSLSKVERGSVLNQMARIMVVGSSSGATIPVTEFALNTNGSANPLTNIDSIMVWYTGANPNLVSPVFFGGSGSNTAPFSITGSRNLLNDTNYFWVTYNIPATANVGDSVDLEVTSITVGTTPQTPSTTAPAGARLIRAPYCASAATVPLADGEIWNVTLGTLNNTSSCTTTGGAGSIQGGYSNFTQVAAPSLLAGSITPFSVNTSTCGGNYDGVLGIWIDFNDDGDFTDAGEEVHMTTPFQYGTAVFRTGDITIPLNVQPGVKRMRVSLIETTVSPISPCASYGYGETEDYSVNILPAPIPTTYVWNQTAAASFTVASNWTPNRTIRNLNDRLAFNANATINNVTTQEVASIDVSNNAVVNLNAAAGETLSAWDSLNLISGRIVGNNNLTLTVGNRTNIGTITGTGGVQGTLARWVDTVSASVNFPLVQGGASRRATLTTPATGAPIARGTVIVRFVPGIPSSAGVPFLDGFLPVNKISENGVWRIEAGNGFNPGPNGEFNLALQADSFAGVTNLSSLTIVRRANATSNWDTAGVYDFTTGTNASFVANRLNLRVFGEFTVGSDSAVNPLPVKLISFNANGVNNDVLLTWKTAMEINNKGFMVERSLDGRKFESVQFVKGNGTTSQVSNYLLLDEKAFNLASTLYYRLRQIDFDETESFSNIVKVERNELNLSNVTAVPNPFVGSTKIEFVSATTSPYTISIVDVQGKEIATRTVNVKEGMNSILLPELEGVNAGIYFVNVNGVESRTLKVVKTAN
ncbi:MAG: GEVED domain-containing protein, partial [Bacteroidia bacterium]|nr:GEVED domain-containing protein [Bacteroidia bacterium]